MSDRTPSSPETEGDTAYRAAIAKYRWWCEACGSLTNDGDCDCTKFDSTSHKQRLRPSAALLEPEDRQ